MKRIISKRIVPVWITAMFLMLVSCEKDADLRPDYNTRIIAEAYYQQAGLKKSVYSDTEIILESFSIVVEEIEFEFDDDEKEMRDDDYVSDIELTGPFELELLDNGESLDQVLAKVTLPEGSYQEVEFEIETGSNPASDMYQKSVKITGTIDGTPFMFWTDETDEIELEFEGSNQLTIDGVREAIVTLSFDLSTIFAVSEGGVHLSNLSDSDGDGIIEIDPESDDGYSDYADDIWERLDDGIEALEDYFTDRDDDDDDDDDDDNDGDDDDDNDDDDDDDDK